MNLSSSFPGEWAIGLEWATNGPQMGHKWAMSGPQMGHEWSMSGPWAVGRARGPWTIHVPPMFVQSLSKSNVCLMFVQPREMTATML